MARARGWYTASGVSGSTSDVALQADNIIADGLTDPTLLRTRAFASLSYSGDDVPPFFPGISVSPLVLRVLVGDAASPPDSTWPAELFGPEDVIFQPLVWGPGLYVPTNAAMSRPEKLYYTADLAGGVADSAAQRHMPGTVDVLVSWYMGAAPGAGAPGDAIWTVNYWFRCLIEATI